MNKIDCKYLDSEGYCHHPDMCCVQECGIILNNNCKLKK